MSRYCKLMLFIALLAHSTSCATGGKSYWVGDAEEGSYRLDVVVGGTALPVIDHGGKSHVAGMLNQRFVVRVHNNGPGRVEAVIAVDGRDTIDGLEADMDKRGYIIEPGAHIDIDGWRTSMNTVATFRFTTESDSYAARLGDPDDLGLIEVAIFKEKQKALKPHPPYVVDSQPGGGHWRIKEKTGAYHAREEAAPSKRLGTRFGETRHSSVTGTTFERASSSPVARLSVHYDDPRNLCAAGIERFCHPYAARPPYRPVEDDRVHQEFAQPPPGWEHYHPWY